MDREDLWTIGISESRNLVEENRKKVAKYEVKSKEDSLFIGLFALSGDPKYLLTKRKEWRRKRLKILESETGGNWDGFVS